MPRWPPPQLGVAPHELRRGRPGPEEVVQDQHLPVARGPAPIPMVGTARASVTAAPTASGTPSMTMPKHPAALEGRPAESTRALAAEASRPGRGSRPWPAPTAGVRPRCPITGISAPPMASTAGARRALELHRPGPGPYQVGGVAHRLFGDEVVAHPRHVPHHEAGRPGAGHGRGADGPSRPGSTCMVHVAEHGVGHRVPDQDHVDTGLGDDAENGLSYAVTMAIGDAPSRRLRVGSVGTLDGPGGAPRAPGRRRVVGPGPATGRIATPGYLRIRWCQAQSGHTSTS